MSISSEPTLDQALALARRLSPQNRAALIARLAQELVVPQLLLTSAQAAPVQEVPVGIR